MKVWGLSVGRGSFDRSASLSGAGGFGLGAGAGCRPTGGAAGGEGDPTGAAGVPRSALSIDAGAGGATLAGSADFEEAGADGAGTAGSAGLAGTAAGADACAGETATGGAEAFLAHAGVSTGLSKPTLGDSRIANRIGLEPHIGPSPRLGADYGGRWFTKHERIPVPGPLDCDGVLRRRSLSRGRGVPPGFGRGKRFASPCTGAWERAFKRSFDIVENGATPDLPQAHCLPRAPWSRSSCSWAAASGPTLLGEKPGPSSRPT